MRSTVREKIWRFSIVVLCALSLLFSAYAVYRIKRLEADSKPRIRLIHAATASR
jgi:hypothetical protein